MAKRRPGVGNQFEEALRARDRASRGRVRDASRGETRPPRNDRTPDLALIDVALVDLKIDGRRLRPGDAAQIERIAKSIEQLGFCQPVIVDREMRLIDGHDRVAAARNCGLTSISAIVIGHLSPPELRLLKIALNRIAETNSWDMEALQAELGELIVLDMPIDVTGFSAPEIDQILMGEEAEAAEEATDYDPCTAPVSRLGDLWRVGKSLIFNGDATRAESYAAVMGHDRATALLTDEPYGVPIAGHVTSLPHREFVQGAGEMSREEFAGFNARWIEASLPFLKNGAILGTFIDWRGLGAVLNTAEAAGLTLLNLITWAKTSAGMGSFYRSQTEFLPLFRVGDAPPINNIKLGRNHRTRSNLWQAPGASTFGSEAREGLKLHPTVKPTALLQPALLDMTNRGDCVVEPFLGSGSMLIACERTGRRCRAIELDPLYVDVAIRRAEATLGLKAVLLATGETFDEVAARRAHAGGDDADERPAASAGRGNYGEAHEVLLLPAPDEERSA